MRRLRSRVAGVVGVGEWETWIAVSVRRLSSRKERLPRGLDGVRATAAQRVCQQRLC
ncbi:hypothetical protein XHV734_1908 [Xanthomonas hortorum pv. vitians]|nr:hypothetical protein XHV734_1908 [Xanthomonas hortorum pv. vitians]